MIDNSAEMLFQSFLQEAILSSSGMGRDVNSLMLSIQHFLCQPQHRQGALEDEIGEAVVVCCVPKPCKFLSLDSCQRRFLWTHKEVDLAWHPVIGLVLQVGDVEKFPQAFGFKSVDPVFRVSKQGPCFTVIEEDGGDKRLVQLKLACKASGVALPDTV